MTVNYTEQVGIFDPSTFGDIATIIGCGGIGATIVTTLVTMGIPQYVLWDPDTIDTRNVSTSGCFRPQDIGRRKVDRIEEYLKEYGAEEVTTHPTVFDPTGENTVDGIVISGVDSMKARRQIWKEHLSTSAVSNYFDLRIGGKHATLLHVEPFDPAQSEWYENKCLFGDEQVAPLPCTQRTIVYPAVALGAYLADYLGKLSRGETIPRRTELDFTGPVPTLLAVKPS